ncbi:MAG: MFS transporter, partial [Clostridiales bacterium]|nr:MFS transporter [Clostridiales bacterium]
SFSIPFLGIGVLALVVFGLFLFTGRKIMPTTAYAHMNDMRKRALENPAEIFRSPKAWLFLVTAILYFSFQYGMSIWMPTYFYYEKGFSHQSSAFMATVFFLGALVMRFLAPILFKKMALEKYYSIFALLSAICTAVAFAVASAPLITFLIFMGGFFQGALIVAFVIICCREFPERTASASSLSVIAFNLSAMVMPVAVGAMAETKGFSLPMYLLVIGLVISIGSLWVAQKIASPKESPVSL